MVPVESYSAPYSGVITANDANNVINPATIAAAIEEYKSSCDSALQKIANQLKAVEPDACEAVIVQRTNIGKKMEETASKINSLASSMGNGLEDLVPKAEAKHDEIQLQYNAAAKQAAEAEYARYRQEHMS